MVKMLMVTDWQGADDDLLFHSDDDADCMTVILSANSSHFAVIDGAGNMTFYSK